MVKCEVCGRRMFGTHPQCEYMVKEFVELSREISELEKQLDRKGYMIDETLRNFSRQISDCQFSVATLKQNIKSEVQSVIVETAKKIVDETIKTQW